MKDNLTTNIDKLIKGTKDGKINWTKLTEHAYVWQTSNSNNKKLNIILQNAKTVEGKVVEVLFRLFDVENKTVLMDVKTDSTSVENRIKIFEIYELVKDNFSLDKLDVLSDLLKDI